MLPCMTKEQKKIVSAVNKGSNIKVDAVAGSGKTTTILCIARNNKNKNKNILVLTYNAKLKFETREKAKNLNLDDFLEVHSYHAYCVKYYNHKGHTDFGINDTVNRNLKKLKDKSYDIIIVDEVQDMTNYLFKFVMKILNDNVKPVQLIVCGDTHQCVYGFKGADERYLLFADRLFTSDNKWKNMALSESFRVTKPMAKFVNDMINVERIISNKDGDKVDYLICNAFLDEPYKMIKKYLETYKPEDIFILAPKIKKGYASNDSPVKRLENRLVSDGTPCFVPTEEDAPLDDDVVKGKVVFATFNSVKGLERKVVMVFNFDMSYFIYYGKDEDRTVCPNKIYVALTRAQEHLILIHHESNKYFPLINSEKLKTTCTIHGDFDESKLETAKEKINQIGVSDLTNHLFLAVIENAMGYIKVKTINKPHKKEINLPHKIQTSPDTCEIVSEINGIMIPTMYEIKTKNDCNIMNIFTNENLRNMKVIENLSVGHQSKIKRIIGSDITKLSKEDLLYMTNVYNSVMTGYDFKREQIKNYTWLNDKDEEVVDCLKLLEKYIGKNGEYEMKYTQEIKKISIEGRTDIIDNNTVWELKCTQELKPENIIQLAIYAWLIERNEPEGYKYKLLNILTNEMKEITYDKVKFERLVEYLVDSKYGKKNKISDDDFIKQNTNIKFGEYGILVIEEHHVPDDEVECAFIEDDNTTVKLTKNSEKVKIV